MNASRVIGPAIGGILYALVGVSWVFLGNAVSYVAIMVAIMRIPVPAIPKLQGRGGPALPPRVGFRYVRDEPVVRRCIATMLIFSFFCLGFITEMPVLATENLGVPSKSTTYGLLYAVFGLGAVAGALSIGTFLAGRSLERIVRVSLLGFAACLATFALPRSPVPAFPVGFVLGFFYFAAVTSLATVFQGRLDDGVRGRARALWVMSFGGTVPIGGLVAGWFVNQTRSPPSWWPGRSWPCCWPGTAIWPAGATPPARRRPRPGARPRPAESRSTPEPSPVSG